MDCIFCKIGNKEMNSDIVYEDNDVVDIVSKDGRFVNIKNCLVKSLKYKN